jgi:ABC-type multidrug transport system ATPase subunit
MLILDEPTNHLDAESVAWLERFLKEYAGTVVAVTHDRYFLDNAAEWILELDRGEGIPWKGNYSSWLEQKGARLANEQKQEDAHRKAMKQELEWVRQGAKARQSKSKARLARYEEMSNVEYQKRNETQEIFIPPGERLGNQVIDFNGVSKGFGDRLLIDNLSFQIPPGAIVGVIGPNGAGKSTLFKMIAGKEQPDSGAVKIGQTVQMAFVEQSREGLEGDKTVFEDVANGADILTVGKFEMPSRAYLGRFNFKGGDQQKKVGMLSGGERGRLHLAKTLLKGGNVLLLDEPSNDLDVETLRALEDALEQGFGQVQAAAFAAGEHADFLLLVAALEVEAAQIGAAGHFELADGEDVGAVGHVFKDGFVAFQAFAALFDKGHLHGLADFHRAAVRLLFAGNHLEQGGFTGAVGADHADDGAGRDLEAEVVDQQAIAKAFGNAIEIDHLIAQALARRDEDFLCFVALLVFDIAHFFVAGETGLALGLAGLGALAHPFQLLLHGLAVGVFLLLFIGEAGAFLLQPAGVVALPRDAFATVEFENPLGGVVKKVAVVRDRHNRARVFL